jgi:hypothetical protein
MMAIHLMMMAAQACVRLKSVATHILRGTKTVMMGTLVLGMGAASCAALRAAVTDW